MIVIIEDRNSKAIKISHTLFLPQNEVAKCQEGNPNPLCLAYYGDGGKKALDSILDEIKEYRTRGGGNWFYARHRVGYVMRTYFPSISATFDDADFGYHLLKRRRKERNIWYVAILSDKRDGRGRQIYEEMRNLGPGNIWEARKKARTEYNKWLEEHTYDSSNHHSSGR